MDVVEPVGVVAQPLHQVHARVVVEVAGIEAESGDVVRDIGDDLPDFVRELDVTAGVRMNDGAYAVAVPRQFGDGDDVRHHRVPLRLGETRRAVRMPGVVVALSCPSP